MDSAKINDWMQVLGIFAVVASLVFVGLQMKQSQDIASAERTMLRAATFVELNSAINEHADVWARGISGDDLDSAENTIFRNLLAAHQQVHQSSYRAARDLGLRDLEKSNLIVYSSFLQENPGARRAWNAREEDYALANQRLYEDDTVPGFVVEVRLNLSKLDQNLD